MITDQDTLYDTDTWEAAARWVIERNGLRPTYFDKAGTLADLYDADNYTGLAQAAWWRLQYAGDWTVDDMVRLLASKQHDYGNDNILKFGAEGIRVRLWDKIARHENLERRDTHPANETVIDTYKDIIGYVVLFKMVNAGTFTLPLRGDL